MNKKVYLFVTLGMFLTLLKDISGQSSLFNNRLPAPRNSFRGTATRDNSFFSSEFDTFNSLFEQSTAPVPATTRPVPSPPPTTTTIATTTTKQRRQRTRPRRNRKRTRGERRRGRRRKITTTEAPNRNLRDQFTPAPSVRTPIPTQRIPSTARRTLPPSQATTQRVLPTVPRSLPIPSQEVIDAIIREVRAFIFNDEEWLPNLVQLVFHSCVGGCDGCLNFAEKDNIGLVDTYATVREFHVKSIGRLLSLADFVVLLGTQAAEIGMQRSDELIIKVPNIEFHPGRVTCVDPDNYHLEHEFPKGDATDGVEFLMEEFDLDRKLAIALLGAHSLGECKLNNSGFVGTWDKTPHSLDNHYYKSLVDTDFWTAVPTPESGSFQWNSSDVEDPPMMLHADMALLHSFELDENKKPLCPTNRSTSCGRSTDSTRVHLYASSFPVWVKDFIEAFLKMVDKKPVEQTTVSNSIF